MEQVSTVIRYTPDVLLFAQWSHGPDAGAILIIKSLDGWLSLADWLRGEKAWFLPMKLLFLRSLRKLH